MTSNRQYASFATTSEEPAEIVDFIENHPPQELRTV